jgi:Na+/H+ antiporter NhaD/arsenite permease-like protein
MSETEGIVPFYSLLPFILMLLCVAVLPITAEKFWEKNSNKFIVALILSIPTVIWLLFNGMQEHLIHNMVFDYVPFILLLGALFVITGGIYIDCQLKASPKVNTAIIALGAILASFMGTTGAAMLLIRPLLRTNKNRSNKIHTVLFFIAIVANCGGLLTPLGDPPLFMMYLRGAEFQWFFSLIWQWLLVNGLLLGIYYFIESRYASKELNEYEKKVELGDCLNRKIKIYGNLNFIWLIGVVLSVAFINENTVPIIKEYHYLIFTREAMFLLMAYLSILFTTTKTRANNHFSWVPIVEVAILFLGIFVTMTPALEFLRQNANDLAIVTPAEFYYATGFLSAFLDNTPTAVTFYYVELGIVELHPEYLLMDDVVAGIPEKIMAAISAAAVFFGALTYIGNGPNFMVKAIAEHSGVKMPDFFSYMVKFSLLILLPVYIIVQLIFYPF